MQSIIKYAASFFAIGVSSAFLVWIDPFGQSEFTAGLSRDIFYRAWSLSYPDTEKPKSVVVLLNDASLGKREYWPVTYKKHAQFLNSVRALRPKAVFFDLAFIDERPDPTLPELIEAFREGHASGISIYVGAARRSTRAQRALRKEFEELAKEGVIKKVSLEFGSRSGQSNSYELNARQSEIPSAARRIRDDICKNETWSGCVELPNQNEYEIWWAAPPNQLNCETGGEMAKKTCDDISKNALVRLAKLTFQGLFGEAASPKLIYEPDPISIPYTPTAFAHELWDRQLPLPLADAFHGAVVFYGMNLSYLTDSTYNPVYGTDYRRKLPGVYFHAMAFDNLMTLGSSLTRTPNEGKLQGKFITWILVLGCCITAFMVTMLLFKLGINLESAVVASQFFCAMLLTLVGCYVLFRYCNFSPANWLGAVTIFLESDLLLRLVRLHPSSQLPSRPV